MKFAPATNLDEVYHTLSTKPLIDLEQFQAFYRGEVNAVRGGDNVSAIAYDLRHAYGGAFYKTFLIGHPGVGKSTEMTRLSQNIASQFRVIRFSAQVDLNSSGFQPFDVLLVMMIKLVEQTAKPVPEGGVGKHLSSALLNDILGWFATEKSTVTTNVNTTADASGGIKTSSSPLAKVLGLFANLKGELKYTADRKKEITEYRFNAIASLVDLLNRVLDECNRLLRESSGCEWLIIGEDFDKTGIPTTQIESLFLNYSSLFDDLRAHLIFNIPVALAYSEKSAKLPLQQICIRDTPVFHKDHSPHEAGRNALQTVLQARIIPDLFEKGQMLRMIIASGGNLRDFFEMILRAATLAGIRTDGKGKIGQSDADAAINEKRSQYLVRLGTSPYDDKELTYDQKAARLVGIYNQEPGNDVPDAALHSLLRARAVQEFNGTCWFGVHPLVVDILQSHGKLEAGKHKNVPGGTR